MSLMQVLAVGDSPSLAFLAWRLAVSQACQVSLVWRGSKISPGGSCQISFASEKFGNAKFTPAFAGNSVSEVLAESSTPRALDYVLISPTSLKHLTSFYKSIDSSLITPNTIFIIDASFYTVGLEQLLRRTFTKNLVLTIICEAELRKIGTNSFVHLGGNLQTVVGIPEDFASVSSYVEMADYFKSILESVALDVTITENYLKYQWSRTIPFLAYEFLSVILESPLPGMLQNELLARPLIVGIVNELSQIASAQGCPLFDDIMSYIDTETARFSQSYGLAGANIESAKNTKPLSFLHSPILFYNMYNSFDIPIDVLLLQPILMADDFQIKTPYLESLFTFLGRMLKVVSGESLLFLRRSEANSALMKQNRDINGGGSVSAANDVVLKERESELQQRESELQQREMRLQKREQYLQKLEQDIRLNAAAAISSPEQRNGRGIGGYASSNSISRLQASPSPQSLVNQGRGGSPNGHYENNVDVDPEDDDFLVEHAPPQLSQDQINGLDMMSMTNRRQRRRVSQGRHHSPPSGNNIAKYSQTDARTETLPGGTMLDLASSDRYGNLSSHNLNSYSRNNSMNFSQSPGFSNGMSMSMSNNDFHSSSGLPFPNMPSMPRRSPSGVLSPPSQTGRNNGVPGSLMNDPINAAAMSLGGNSSYLSSTRPSSNQLKSNGGSLAFGQMLGNVNGNANGHLNGNANGNGSGSGSGSTSVDARISDSANGNNASQTPLGGSNLYSQIPIRSGGSANNAENANRSSDVNAYGNVNGHANGNEIGNAYGNMNGTANGSVNESANTSDSPVAELPSAPASAPASSGKKFGGIFRKKKK